MHRTGRKLDVVGWRAKAHLGFESEGEYKMRISSPRYPFAFVKESTSSFIYQCSRHVGFVKLTLRLFTRSRLQRPKLLDDPYFLNMLHLILEISFISM